MKESILFDFATVQDLESCKQNRSPEASGQSG